MNTIPGNLENQVVNQLVSVMSSFPVFILFIFHQCFQWLLLLGKQIFGSIYLRNVACPVDPWVRKIPWRGKWQTTPVFFPGKSHGGLQSKGLQRSRTHPSDWIITKQIWGRLIKHWMLWNLYPRTSKRTQITLPVWSFWTSSHFIKVEKGWIIVGAFIIVTARAGRRYLEKELTS